VTLEVLENASQADLAFLAAEHEWHNNARPEQVLPLDNWTAGTLFKGNWTPEVDPAPVSQCIAMAGRGWGKALGVCTNIPTPNGWTRLGDLRPGDSVFDESGRVCRIIAVYERSPQRAYRLHFSDGTHIDACDEHQWVTWTHRDRKQYQRYEKPRLFPDEWPAFEGRLRDSWDNVTGSYGPKIRTTQEIVDTFYHSSRGDRNHCIPLAEPLRLPDVELPNDPWTMGYWLGNGSHDQPTLCAGSYNGDMDAGFVTAQLERAGYPYSRIDRVDGGYSVVRILEGAFNIPQEKRLSPLWLRAGTEQRRALLRGLMDSDGHLPENQHAEFCSANKGLAHDVLELVRTLGERPVMTIDRARLNGRDMGPRYRVKWRPSLFNPFSLPRKARRYVEPDAQGLRLRHRMIVRYEEIAPTPMRCLTVDSRHSMFLCGDGFIPTHNTKTGASWVRRMAGLYPGTITHVVAPTYSDLRGVIFEGPSGIKASIPAALIKSLTYSPYPEMVLWNGSIIRGFSSESPDRIRGPQCTFLWGDELAAWYRPEENLSNIDFSTRIAYKLPDGRLVQPQKFYTTTPRPLQWLAKMLKSSRVIRGSTYENEANLADAFFATLAQYEGTEIGRQELHGELLDISEAAIIKKSWLRMWPASDPLPWFEYIIVSLDTAFTEKSFDKKSFEADPSACSVWGVFKHDRRWNLLLLECWEDYLGFPDLVKRARKEMQAEYGRRTETIAGTTLVGQNYHRLQIKKPDLMVIEEKGSGISLRQMLSAEGIDTYPYNPGNADKLARLHAVSHLPHAGRIWLPEGARVNKVTGVRTPTGEFANWSVALTDQLCVFSGPGTTKHDDYVDTCSQCWRVFADKFVSEGLEVKLPDGEVPSLPGATPALPDPYAPRVIGAVAGEDDGPRYQPVSGNPYD